MSDPKEHREQGQEDLAESTEDLEAPREAAKQTTGAKRGIFGKLGIFKATHDKREAG